MRSALKSGGGVAGSLASSHLRSNLCLSHLQKCFSVRIDSNRLPVFEGELTMESVQTKTVDAFHPMLAALIGILKTFLLAVKQTSVVVMMIIFLILCLCSDFPVPLVDKANAATIYKTEDWTSWGQLYNRGTPAFENISRVPCFCLQNHAWARRPCYESHSRGRLCYTYFFWAWWIRLAMIFRASVGVYPRRPHSGYPTSPAERSSGEKIITARPSR